MNPDQRAAEILKQAREAWGPDPFEVLLKASDVLPERWREWRPDRSFEYLRCRLEFTQDELARKAGLTQSQVSRLEGGEDALLSTWRKVYAAMGFDLIMLPVSRLTAEELRKRATEGRPAGHWRRQRARPRRRWLKLKEEAGGPGSKGLSADGSKASCQNPPHRLS